MTQSRQIQIVQFELIREAEQFWVDLSRNKTKRE